ncbi:hypothetical protein [Poseidonocella sedimentorum]|uniref:Sulfotransferase family protein n=1 Tax=Poseidonocella sedimentorum TaxID=871652 RepID=A0A1I6DGR0_9RHOB|nr:hypothetical protein [Poseidonocella sedimentorum]SFR04624.1 hypothetical protein SAMN04515673_103209 [Poseidonocella sedimentorum]
MMIFFEARLVFFAVPKTGSTAYHAALSERADIIFRNRPGLKHTNTRRFDREIQPFLRDIYGLRPERLALMRAPLDHLASWYRYRTRLPEGAPKSTAGISFDAFVEASLSDAPPAFADVGSQLGFLTNREGALRVHHLCASENTAAVLGFLEARLGGGIEVARRNVSPPAETQLDPGLEAEFRAARAAEFALYERVAESGYLRSEMSLPAR